MDVKEELKFLSKLKKIKGGPGVRWGDRVGGGQGGYERNVGDRG